MIKRSPITKAQESVEELHTRLFSRTAADKLAVKPVASIMPASNEYFDINKFRADMTMAEFCEILYVDSSEVIQGLYNAMKKALHDQA